MHHIVTCSLLCLVAALAGCAGIHSTHPVAGPEASRVDTRLFGSWVPLKRSDRGAYRLDVEPGAGGTARLRILVPIGEGAETSYSQAFDLTCVDNEEHRFCSLGLTDPVPGFTLDMEDGRLHLDPRREGKIPAGAAFSLARVEIRENGDVAVFGVAAEDAQTLLQAESPPLAQKLEGGGILINAPAEALPRYLATRPGLFGANPTVFTPLEENTGPFGTLRRESPEQKLSRLLADLDHPDPKRRFIAANALGDMGPAASEAVPALTQAIWRALETDDGDDLRVAEAAAGALGKIDRPYPEAEDALLELYGVTDQTTHEAIVEALAATAREDPDIKKILNKIYLESDCQSCQSVRRAVRDALRRLDKTGPR